jgi:hypothetical protein
MPLWREQGTLYLYLHPDTFLDLIRTVAKLRTHTENYANKHTFLFAYQIQAVFSSRDGTCNMP